MVQNSTFGCQFAAVGAHPAGDALRNCRRMRHDLSTGMVACVLCVCVRMCLHRAGSRSTCSSQRIVHSTLHAAELVFAQCVVVAFGPHYLWAQRRWQRTIAFIPRARCGIDMGAKKETPEDRAARFQRRALEESTKGLFKRCVTAMKKNPGSLAQVYRVLRQHGAVEADTEFDQVMGISGANAKAEESMETPVKKQKREEDEIGSAGAADGASPLAASSTDTPTRIGGLVPDISEIAGHRNYSSLGAALAKLLAALLSKVEPVAFSAAHLNNLLKEGRRCFEKDPLLMLTEFVTGYDPHHVFPTEDRTPERLAEILCAKNESMQRRGRDLELPPHWPDCGVYEVASVPGEKEYTLKHRFNGKSALIPEGLLAVPHHDGDEVIIDFNYSDAKACLYLPSGIKIASCAQLIPLPLEADLLQIKRRQSSSSFAYPLNAIAAAKTKKEEAKAEIAPDNEATVSSEVAGAQMAPLVVAPGLEPERVGNNNSSEMANGVSASSVKAEFGQTIAPGVAAEKSFPPPPTAPGLLGQRQALRAEGLATCEGRGDR